MKKNKEREKKYDIKKIIEKRGGYRPLCFHENGEDFKFDYNLDEYCRVLVDKAKLSTSASTKAELLADISTFIQVFSLEKPFIPLLFREGMAYYSRELTYEDTVNEYELFANIYSWSVTD